MSTEATLALVTFVCVSSAVLFIYTLAAASRSRLDGRIEELVHPAEFPVEGDRPSAPASVKRFTRSALPTMGSALMTSDEERSLLKTRLMHAGCYGGQAVAIFLGAKFLAIVAPTLIGLLLTSAGLVSMRYGVTGGACLGIVGMIGASAWLDSAKGDRQQKFRRALPDALDVLVICLEGGLSLTGALKRVASELSTAHPDLAAELNIVQREMQLGRPPGDALQQMGIRTDLEEVRGLAAVITQAERFGASLVRSLRVHADTLRQKRQQQAEEMAHQASVKILIPTIFFIFPAMFVVVLGPAIFRAGAMFSAMGQR